MLFRKRVDNVFEETEQDIKAPVDKNSQTSATGAVELQDNLFMDSEGRFYVPS